LAPRPDLAGSPSLELVRTRVSAILVSYNSGGALLRCLATIGDDVDEIVIVNNGDWGPELDVAAARGGVAIVAAYDNAGFGAGANLGASLATGDVLVFLNPDTVVTPGAIPELVRTLSDESVGI